MINSRGRAVVLLGLVFAAGVTGGLVVERYALHDVRVGADRGRDGDRRNGESTIERFADELGVTPEQRASIDPILVRTRERMSGIYDRYRPEWEAVIDSARAQIEAVLSPEQVEQYRALLEKQGRGDRNRGRRGEGDPERDQD
jgi:Spy/CpxP family protein refolding chaperone